MKTFLPGAAFLLVSTATGVLAMFENTTKVDVRTTHAFCTDNGTVGIEDDYCELHVYGKGLEKVGRRTEPKVSRDGRRSG